MTMDLSDLRRLLVDDYSNAPLEAPDADRLIAKAHRRRRQRAAAGAAVMTLIVVAAIAVPIASETSASGGGIDRLVPANPDSGGHRPQPDSPPTVSPAPLPAGIRVIAKRLLPQLGGAGRDNLFVGFALAGRANEARIDYATNGQRIETPANGPQLVVHPLDGQTPPTPTDLGFPTDVVRLDGIPAQVTTSQTPNPYVIRIDWIEKDRLYQLISGGRAKTPYGFSGLSRDQMLALARYAASVY